MGKRPEADLCVRPGSEGVLSVPGLAGCMASSSEELVGAATGLDEVALQKHLSAGILAGKAVTIGSDNLGNLV